MYPKHCLIAAIFSSVVAVKVKASNYLKGFVGDDVGEPQPSDEEPWFTPCDGSCPSEEFQCVTGAGEKFCIKSTSSGEDMEIAIRVGGGDDNEWKLRKAVVHLPPQATREQSMPLVLNIHAMACDPGFQSWFTGFDLLADREGFVVLYPQGQSAADVFDDPWGVPLADGYTFNAGGCCPAACRDKVDDVGYIRALVEFVSETWAPQQGFAIDPDRIYATGLSNGGFMSHRLGCEMSDVVAAIAPVAAVMTEMNHQILWDDDPYVCQPEFAPIPVLHIHDWTDELVPWYGGGAGFNFPAVQESIRRWRVINNVDQVPGVTSYRSSESCRYSSTGETFYGVDCTSYGSGRSNVTLCAMQCTKRISETGTGHSWPGDHGGNSFFQASEQIWEFFKSNPKTHSSTGP